MDSAAVDDEGLPRLNRDPPVAEINIVAAGHGQAGAVVELAVGADRQVVVFYFEVAAGEAKLPVAIGPAGVDAIHVKLTAGEVQLVVGIDGERAGGGDDRAGRYRDDRAIAPVGDAASADVQPAAVNRQGAAGVGERADARCGGECGDVDAAGGE